MNDIQPAGPRVSLQSVDGVMFNDLLVMHEDIYPWFKKNVEAAAKTIKSSTQVLLGVDQPRQFIVGGLDVQIVKGCPKHPLVWKFPHDHQWVIYEQSDEAWAKPIRFGHFVRDENVLAIWLLSRRNGDRSLTMTRYDNLYQDCPELWRFHESPYTIPAFALKNLRMIR